MTMSMSLRAEARLYDSYLRLTIPGRSRDCGCDRHRYGESARFPGIASRLKPASRAFTSLSYSRRVAIDRLRVRVFAIRDEA